MNAEDEAAFRRLAYLYAQAVDRNLPDQFADIFTEDAVLEAPTGRSEGRAKLRAIPGFVASRYLRTFHAVYNQVVHVTGETAQGETYCRASHLFPTPAKNNTICYDMIIRYQDRFRRAGGAWKFSARTLIVDWTSVAEARPGPEA